MRQNANNKNNHQAIEYAVHNHLDLVVNHPAKLPAILKELMVLLSTLQLMDTNLVVSPSTFALLQPLAVTIEDYLELFELSSLRTVLSKCIQDKINFFQEKLLQPEEYIARVNHEREWKQKQFEQHLILVRRRRIEDKISQLPRVELSSLQNLVIENLFNFLTTMSQTNLLASHGFSELDEDDQESHCVTLLLNHAIEDVPLSAYLEKGHIDKILHTVELDEGEVTLFYLLLCAIDGRFMSSSLGVIESLLCNFKEVLYDDDANCRYLADICYYHESVEFVSRKVTYPGLSIPFLLSDEPVGIRLLHEYPKLFEFSDEDQQGKMLGRFSRYTLGIDLICENIQAFDAATSDQQRSCVLGLSCSTKGLKLLYQASTFLAVVEEYELGSVVVKLAQLSEGAEVLMAHSELFGILNTIQQRALLDILSESEAGVTCLNSCIDECLEFFDNTKDLVLSDTFLLNIVKNDPHCRFFQSYLLSDKCYHEFAAKFRGFLLLPDLSDSELVLNELSLTAEGVSFLANQATTLLSLSPEQKEWLLDQGFINNVFRCDDQAMLIWSVYYHPKLRDDFLEIFANDTTLQETFLSHDNIKERVTFLLAEPRLLFSIKPSVLVQIKYPDAQTSLAQYLRVHDGELMHAYPQSNKLTAMMARQSYSLMVSGTKAEEKQESKSHEDHEYHEDDCKSPLPVL